MKNISELKNCYGCGVCVVACPVSIISLCENKDGFYQPVISEQDKCIDCGLCLRTCSFHNPSSSETPDVKSFAAWNTDVQIRALSSSGGISSEIAKISFIRGYKALGARYNPVSKRVEHFSASSPEEFMPAMGSKYLQSYTADAFHNIDFKNKEEKWMIVGTPCQIDSLRRLARIKKAEDRFLLVDFFCHGVPSRLLWLKYLDELAKKGVDISQTFRWRDKKDGWHDSWAVTDNTYFSKWTDGDLFYTIFLGNYCLNRCCYNDCKFKKTASSADIRIGDLWGKRFIRDENGVSALVSFTPVGDRMMVDLKDSCIVQKVDLKDILDSQMEKLTYRALPHTLTLAILKSNLPLETANFVRRIFNHL